MSHKMQKVIVIIVVATVFLFSLVQVYAQGLGLDFATLVKTKIAYLTGTNTANVPTDLANARGQVENDVLNYVDEYIAGLNRELKDYTNQEINAAQGKLDEKVPGVKGELNSVRAELMEQAKLQIKAIVEEQYKIEESKLNEDLQSKIEEKFK